MSEEGGRLEVRGGGEEEVMSKNLTYYYDGNNMMFMTNSLRGLRPWCSPGRDQVGQILVRLCQKFHEESEFVQRTHLLFDFTRLTGSEKRKDLKDLDDEFTIYCARPEFETADDMLVSFARELRGEGEDEFVGRDIVFVTSDVELIGRLREVLPESEIISPKTWLRRVCCGSSNEDEDDMVLDAVVRECSVGIAEVVPSAVSRGRGRGGCRRRGRDRGRGRGCRGAGERHHGRRKQKRCRRHFGRRGPVCHREVEEEEGEESVASLRKRIRTLERELRKWRRFGLAIERVVGKRMPSIVESSSSSGDDESD